LASDHDSKLSFGDQFLPVEARLEINVGVLKKMIKAEGGNLLIQVDTTLLEVWDGNDLRKPDDGEEIPEGEELPVEKRLHSFDFSIKTRLRSTSMVGLSEGDSDRTSTATSRVSTAIWRRSS
jgi:hypothetical protein